MIIINLKTELNLSNSSANNPIGTNYIKEKIDNKRQNSKCRLCSDRDETVNHIISECNKLAQKEYKTRHNWVGKIKQEIKFEHTTK